MTVLPDQPIRELVNMVVKLKSEVAKLNAEKHIDKIVILSHGFLNSRETEWVKRSRPLIQGQEFNTSVLVSILIN